MQTSASGDHRTRQLAEMTILIGKAGRPGLVPPTKGDALLVPQPKSDRSSSVNWSTVAIGFEFVAAIGGFAVIGSLIDWWRGTEPFWTLIMLLLGFIGGSYNLYKEVKKIKSVSYKRSPRKDSGEVDPKAASAEVAATRGRPRPSGRVNLFAREDIDLEDLDEVELDWPAEERDEVEDALRRAKQQNETDPEDENPH